MGYNFREIEAKWQKYWAEYETYKAEINPNKKKFYVLDMFPYPSGAGLHVGHPLGYIASDILARYKRLQGFEVLHPMGYDSFGLPAEQYAIQTGQHPAVTTDKNIKRYRDQMDRIGFSFDWSREIRTSDPSYYKWTQWLFLKFFNSWYSNDLRKALPIANLIEIFELLGSQSIDAACTKEMKFSADEWNSWSSEEQQEVLLNYRLAYLSDAVVNWCPELGTVLANDEVKDGVSVRGGYPVEQRLMKQWSFRITAYADRLLEDLENLDWPESIKETQRNWIGKSKGAVINFDVIGHKQRIDVFTTRPDTVFGVSFMVLAPEHPLVLKITNKEHLDDVKEYINQSRKRSARERMADTKHISGAFTGAYADHPFTEEDIPIWISDYVLMDYGSGAIMAVPAGDQRDWDFANHFGLPIPDIFKGVNLRDGACTDKNAMLINSSFLSGMTAEKAIHIICDRLEESGKGRRETNFKLRDAVFSRQRYWGEPIPIYYENGLPKPMIPKRLPLELPEVDKYLPTEQGEAPLARAKNWTTKDGHPIETHTMPGWAGSSWYYLRYMDPRNEHRPFDREAADYWKNVDVYIGGAEHATGHLLYVRFWTKFLHDCGMVPFSEPAKKLINQGMIQGSSRLAYRHKKSGVFVSADLVSLLQSESLSLNGFNKKFSKELKTPLTDLEFVKVHMEVSYVDGEVADIEAIKSWRPEFEKSLFVSGPDGFLCTTEVEKMSKSKYNVVNPDEIIDRNGADALRLHEMFLGPIEMHKPWNTKGIDGVSRFLRKLWALFYDKDEWIVNDDDPSPDALKVLHKTIKKVQDDLDRYSFNTVVSHLMIAVNELTDLKCRNRAILEPLLVLTSCHAPHISEELWNKLGNTSSITMASFPAFDESVLEENVFEYPVSFNGKMRFKLTLPTDITADAAEKQVLADERSAKWIGGKPPKKFVFVPNRIINIVV
ncbi:MAG TPA: leucine--tRNA ligase [Flavobacteriales bacterium]|jgi:leucyl-tRNA synthetase|nr:leucine--tRNA ligase [Flavobacteriales bacterium]